MEQEVKKVTSTEAPVVAQKIDPRKLEGRCKICGKPIFKTDGVGATCEAHKGKIRQFAKELAEAPKGYLRMSEVCRKAVNAGLKISAVVNAAGGDACTKPTIDPVFDIVYVGKGKYMNPEVLTKGFALLKKAAESKLEVKSEKATAPVAEALKAEIKK